MNILLINYEYPPIGAGGANATYNIAKCFVRKGHRVTVITSCFGSMRGWQVEEGISVYRCLAIRKKRSQSNIFEMLSFVISAFGVLPFIIRKQKIDASIVFFSFPCGPLGLWGKIISGIPYLVSLRGGDVPGNEVSLNFLHGLLKPIRRMVFRNSAGIIANSIGLKYLSEKSDPYSVKYIPNGVDTHFFFPGNFKKNSNRKLLFVGRFQHQKNLRFLLEQFDLAAREIDGMAELHLVGGGPMEDELREYAEKLTNKNRIFFHNWCSKEDLRRHYQKADCFVNPSFYEGMPNTVLEAMACGCPVIASNVLGNSELVNHGETGFLFNLDTPENLRRYLIMFFKSDGVYVSMANKGINLVKNEFSWEKVASNYLNLLNNSFYREG